MNALILAAALAGCDGCPAAVVERVVVQPQVAYYSMPVVQQQIIRERVVTPRVQRQVIRQRIVRPRVERQVIRQRVVVGH